MHKNNINVLLVLALLIIFINDKVGGQQSQPLNVVPYPQSVNIISPCSIGASPGSISFNVNIESVTFSVAIERYANLLFPFTNISIASDKIELQIIISSDDETLQLGIDESYSLLISEDIYELKSTTIYGAMRGLETFKQMVVYDIDSNSYSLVCAEIQDYPRFPWRGFMIDSARHFYPKNLILHIIDSLGYNKFNTMHWHIEDINSFPVQSSTYPDLTKASFGPGATYSHDDIKEIVAYAKTYGIRVIPEFDIPAHVASWGVGYPELLADCPILAKQMTNIPFDISNPNTYKFIGNLFAEIAPLFQDQYFHTGGDELVMDCWSEDDKIQSWMTKMNFSTVDAFQYFEDQLDITMRSINRKKITWNDPFDYGVKLEPETLVQVWTRVEVLQEVLNAGYKALVSFNWYLDRQVPDVDIHYEWQDTWQDFYEADPTFNITNGKNNILGGETAMWSEQVSSVNWDVRVWPRAIGIAERLWSDSSVNNVTSALPRIGGFSCDMSRRGILSGPLFPDYCPLPEDLSFSFKPNSKLSKIKIISILKK